MRAGASFPRLPPRGDEDPYILECAIHIITIHYHIGGYMLRYYIIHYAAVPVRDGALLLVVVVIMCASARVMQKLCRQCGRQRAQGGYICHMRAAERDIHARHCRCHYASIYTPLPRYSCYHTHYIHTPQRALTLATTVSCCRCAAAAVCGSSA